MALNDDVLSEILVHLPAKTLARFKSVCKDWNNIISCAAFSRRHMLRHPSPYCSFFFSPRRPSPGPPQFRYFNYATNTVIPFHSIFPADADVKIRQSCYGLLLVECGYEHKEKEYYVYNPCTAQSRNLHLDHRHRILGLHLTFHPSVSHYYKVTCLKLIGSNIVGTEAYQSDTKTWSEVNKVYIDGDDDTHSLIESGVLWRNCIYSGSGGRFWCLDLDDGSISCVWTTSPDPMQKEMMMKGDLKMNLIKVRGVFTMFLFDYQFKIIIKNEKCEEVCDSEDYWRFEFAAEIMYWRNLKPELEDDRDKIIFANLMSKHRHCYNFVEFLAPV